MKTIKQIKEWIKKARETPNNDPTYGKVDDWDRGYDECLDAIEEFFGFEKED